MKTLFAATLATSLLAGSIAVADPHDRGYDRDHRRGPPEWAQDRGHRDDHRRWARGERLPDTYWRHHRYVDYRTHHLRRPPRGYQWVEVDNNYILVALTTGLIAELVNAR